MINLKNESGAAMLMTLLFITLITALVVQFVYAGWVEARISSHYRDRVRAKWAAQAGLTAAGELLKYDAAISGQTDNLNEKWAIQMPPMPIGDSAFSLLISDENAKINLAEMVTPSGYPNDKQIELVRRLFRILELPEEKVDPIVDWMDKDDDTRFAGAESDYYESLDIPYKTRNARIESVGDLRYVRGIDPETFSKIAPYLTIRSDGKVNVNTAGKTVLMSLTNKITDQVADEILARRAEKPFDSGSDLSAMPGGNSFYPDIALLITVRSDYFRVAATGIAGETAVTAETIVRRSPTEVKTVYRRMD